MVSRDAWEKESVLSEIVSRNGPSGWGVSAMSPSGEDLVSPRRLWDPIQGGCEGINNPEAQIVDLSEAENNRAEQAAWDSELYKVQLEAKYSEEANTLRGWLKWPR